ncbi:MAG: DUF4230 domain-containing protein [Oscillospiraceae bacterium]|nr:DUF4230 domain-containing protein [Oscillospiraceae bacterium]
MKKAFILFLTVVILAVSTGCAKQPEPINMEPELTQMKSICKLSVMDCYYHNVAKFKEENATGILFWQKDKSFWIEYSGIVRLGIDASLVNMEVNDTQVTITIPEAKVLGCKVDSSSLNEESYIVDKDSAKITAEDEVAAFKEAQDQLEQTAANNKALLAEAQQQVQNLLENYVTNIGNVVGKTYSIKWVYMDTDGNSLGSSGNTSAPSTPESSGAAESSSTSG